MARGGCHPRSETRSCSPLRGRRAELAAALWLLGARPRTKEPCRLESIGAQRNKSRFVVREDTTRNEWIYHSYIKCEAHGHEVPDGICSQQRRIRGIVVYHAGEERADGDSNKLVGIPHSQAFDMFCEPPEDLYKERIPP